jgi:hypothetical protein
MTDSLTKQAQDFLVAINLVTPATTDPKTASDVIRSDALDLNKWVVGIVSAAGGIGAIGAGLNAWLGDLQPPAVSVLFASAALLLSVVVVVIGWVAVTDARVRERLEVARTANRAECLEEFKHLVAAPVDPTIAVDGSGSTFAIVPSVMARRLGDADDSRRVVLAGRVRDGTTELLSLDDLKKKLEWIKATEVDQYFHTS